MVLYQEFKYINKNYTHYSRQKLENEKRSILYIRTLYTYYIILLIFVQQRDNCPTYNIYNNSSMNAK